MHDALAVTEIQRLQKLEYVVPHIEVVELGVQAPEIGVVDVLKDERWSLALHSSFVRKCSCYSDKGG